MTACDLADLNSVLSFYNKSVPVVIDAPDYNLDGGASMPCPAPASKSCPSHRVSFFWLPASLGFWPMDEGRNGKKHTPS